MKEILIKRANKHIPHITKLIKKNFSKSKFDYKENNKKKIITTYFCGGDGEREIEVRIKYTEEIKEKLCKT